MGCIIDPGNSSNDRDAQYFNPRPGYSFIIIPVREEVLSTTTTKASLLEQACQYPSDASYGSEQESASVGFGPSSRHSSNSFTGNGSIGYEEASSGSASDCASDDDLVNCHFAGTFP
ncbi:hypothetical protein PIB30_034774 [Stylosanthes scabra]|uniref:Uncharacterized protein n=1 Tax=Stylosanthes scabra TaxID=79078 RepID=A0ABU6RD70_9FABA|nr:hypothetical protein [Stylosanthes scabra]